MHITGLDELFTVDTILACPSHESNLGPSIYKQTLYHVTIKVGLCGKAVEVRYMPVPCDIDFEL